MKKFLITLFVSCIILLSSQSVFASGGGVISVYRVYNPVNGEHLFTPEKSEVASLEARGWRAEGTAFTVPYAEDSQLKVYRLYCRTTGKHLYTTDTSEVDRLNRTGIWTTDFNGAPIFGAYPEDSFMLKKPVYRLYNSYSRTHLLTADANEYNVLGSQGWNQEGVAFYAYQYDFD